MPTNQFFSLTPPEPAQIPVAKLLIAAQLVEGGGTAVITFQEAEIESPYWSDSEPGRLTPDEPGIYVLSWNLEVSSILPSNTEPQQVVQSVDINTGSSQNFLGTMVADQIGGFVAYGTVVFTSVFVLESPTNYLTFECNISNYEEITWSVGGGSAVFYRLTGLPE